jgi:hypothetical protein
MAPAEAPDATEAARKRAESLVTVSPDIVAKLAKWITPTGGNAKTDATKALAASNAKVQTITFFDVLRL